MNHERDVPRSASERVARLRVMRDDKMADTAHAFVRARADLFYEVVASLGASIPTGPAIWISGDAHMENFGAVPDVDGKVELLPNDFDESVVGNPAHDVTRLSLSFATAARSLGRPGREVHAICAAVVEGYQAALDRVIDPQLPKRENKSQRLQDLVRESEKQTRRDLLIKVTGEDHPRALPFGERYWPLSAASREALAAMTKLASIRELTAGLPMEPLDEVFRVAGTASLGAFRAAILVSVEGAAKGERLRMLDVKEATKCFAPALAGTPGDHADRCIMGARVLAPSFGARKRAVTVQAHRAVVRELMPQEKKVESDRITGEELPAVAFWLGRVIGRAHGRQLAAKDAKSWRAELGAKHVAGRPPDWLSSALFSLVGAHESAYLAHCAEGYR